MINNSLMKAVHKKIEEEIDDAIKIFKSSIKRRISKKQINFYRSILLMFYIDGFEEDFKSYIRLMERK